MTDVKIGAAGVAQVLGSIPSVDGVNPVGTPSNPFCVTLAGATPRDVGPFYETMAASQTAVALKFGGAVGLGWVAPRAGSVTAVSAEVDAAVTGSGLQAALRVYKNGALLAAALDMVFTQAGANTKVTATFAAGLYTFAAGDVITVVCTSGAITNTPNVSATLEATC